MAMKAEKSSTSKRTPMGAKPAFVFFNCDEAKSEGSMNIFWENNRMVYRDLKGARKLLWEKIEQEMEIGRVHIEANDLEAAKSAVLDGDPTKASAFIKNGAIVSIECI